MSKRTLGHQGLSIIRATADRLEKPAESVMETKTVATLIPRLCHPTTPTRPYTKQQRRRARAMVEARTVRLIDSDDIRRDAPSYIALHGRILPKAVK